MKKIQYILCAAFLALCAAACQRAADPIPERVSDLKAYPGIGRVVLEFTAPAEAYTGKVYYGGGSVKDFRIDRSAQVQRVEVSGLSAGEETFRVVTLDVKGKESLPKGITVVIGESSWTGTLANRKFIKLQQTGPNQVEITFDKAAAGEAGVVITYTDLASQVRQKTLSPDQTTIVIDDIDTDRDYTYHTVYKPSGDFVDEYAAVRVNIREAALMQLDKSVWLLSDTPAASDFPLSSVIDGKPLTSWVAASKGEQSFTVNMQTVKLFSGVSLTQGRELTEGTMAKHFTLEVSQDGSAWEQLLDQKLMGNCFAQEFPFDAPVKAQYLRVTLSGAYTDAPLQLGEFDLFNDLFTTAADDSRTMPSLVNGVPPFEGDGEQGFAPALQSPGRMQRAVGWNTSDPSMITFDASGKALCVWTAEAWGIPCVTNGKVWQTVELVPGYYDLKLTIRNTTDIRGLDCYAVVTRGASLPDIGSVATDTNVLTFIDMPAHQQTVQVLPFTIMEDATISIGWVYTTHDYYVITGVYPWSDLYIDGIELEAL